MKHRRSIRLKGYDYKQAGAYFVTVCTRGRECLFGWVTDCEMRLNDIGRKVRSAWEELPTRFADMSLDAFIVMPNHIHILAEAAKKSCNLSKFISHFKQTTAYFYKQKTNEPLWQPRYYDHILRNPKDTEPIAQYIWQNPIRKGLCQNPRDYQLSGSQTINWKEHCSTPTDWSPPWKPFHRPIQNTPTTV